MYVSSISQCLSLIQNLPQHNPSLGSICMSLGAWILLSLQGHPEKQTKQTNTCPTHVVLFVSSVVSNDILVPAWRGWACHLGSLYPVFYVECTKGGRKFPGPHIPFTALSILNSPKKGERKLHSFLFHDLWPPLKGNLYNQSYHSLKN